jgi:hypothetical protein
MSGDPCFVRGELLVAALHRVGNPLHLLTEALQRRPQDRPGAQT